MTDIVSGCARISGTSLTDTGGIRYSGDIVGFTTDKIMHGYLQDYLRLAVELGESAVICEIGVSPASLEMWQSLFHNGLIIGIDPQLSGGTLAISASQDDPDLADKVRLHAPGGCDLIVDDATHRGSMSQATFTNLWPLVKPGGYYVIEDWADPWVFPLWALPPSDLLVDYVPALIESLKNGAARVTYTYEGLVIIQKGLPGYDHISSKYARYYPR